MSIAGWIVVGLLAGALARWIVQDDLLLLLVLQGLAGRRGRLR